MLKYLQLHEIRFGIKVGVATLLMSLPEILIPAFFAKFKGDSALITLIIVLSPTVGGSLGMGIIRIFGTIAGATFGLLTWWAAPGNAFVIVIGSVLWSFPWWYVLLTSPSYTKLGITSLLTFGLITISSMTSYTPLSIDEVVTSTLNTTLAVLIGVIFALFVTSYVWPFLARVELRLALSRTLQDLGFVFGKLAVVFFEGRARLDNPPPLINSQNRAGTPDTIEQLSALYSSPTKDSYAMSDFTRKAPITKRAATVSTIASVDASPLHTISLKRLTRKIRYALDLERELVVLAENEPRLAKRFNRKVYDSAIESMQVLLERMVSISYILGVGNDDTTRKGRRLSRRANVIWNSQVTQEAILPTHKYRRDMIGAVMLHIHVLAGSLSSKTPLPPFLPAVRAARVRLMVEIRRLPFLLGQKIQTEYFPEEREEIEEVKNFDDDIDDNEDENEDDSDSDDLDSDTSSDWSYSQTSHKKKKKRWLIFRSKSNQNSDSDSSDSDFDYETHDHGTSRRPSQSHHQDSEYDDTHYNSNPRPVRASIEPLMQPQTVAFKGSPQFTDKSPRDFLGTSPRLAAGYPPRETATKSTVVTDTTLRGIRNETIGRNLLTANPGLKPMEPMLTMISSATTIKADGALDRAGVKGKRRFRRTNTKKQRAWIEKERATKRRRKRADYIYFFAYSQAQQAIIEELENLSRVIRDIVGQVEINDAVFSNRTTPVPLSPMYGAYGGSNVGAAVYDEGVAY
ncbi:hypothetical protein HK096_005989 [Nowakowskiella sp. JEL0078]|nr:hypothetical protein HK096_005989 [Nowakowskiella sp. JEL0078]